MTPSAIFKVVEVGSGEFVVLPIRPWWIEGSIEEGVKIAWEQYKNSITEFYPTLERAEQARQEMEDHQMLIDTEQTLYHKRKQLKGLVT
jgi:hypothetical protein